MKTNLIKFLIILICLFILLWTYDALSTSFSPDYKPLLSFLQIAQGLLQVVVGM